MSHTPGDRSVACPETTLATDSTSGQKAFAGALAQRWHSADNMGSLVGTAVDGFAEMPRFNSHIFVCCNQREPGHRRGCCDPEGSAKLRDCFKQELARQHAASPVRANKSGCLDQCEYGPTVVIYPQGIWYGRVRPEDVPRIVEETILGGRVVDELSIPDECLNTKGRVPWPRAADAQDSNEADA